MLHVKGNKLKSYFRFSGMIRVRNLVKGRRKGSMSREEITLKKVWVLAIW
jgi:hypothetical protein